MATTTANDVAALIGAFDQRKSSEEKLNEERYKKLIACMIESKHEEYWINYADVDAKLQDEMNRCANVHGYSYILQNPEPMNTPLAKFFATIKAANSTSPRYLVDWAVGMDGGSLRHCGLYVSTNTKDISKVLFDKDGNYKMGRVRNDKFVGAPDCNGR